MSFIVSRAVKASDLQPSGLRLVALVLADYAHDTGRSVYPSLETIGEECALSRKQARRHVATLVASGVLVLVTDARQHSTAVYRFDLDVLHGLCTPWAERKAADKAARGGGMGATPESNPEAALPPLRDPTHAIQGSRPWPSEVPPMGFRGPAQGLQGSRPGPSGVPPTTPYPHDPHDPKGVGGNGGGKRRSRTVGRTGAKAPATTGGELTVNPDPEDAASVEKWGF